MRNNLEFISFTILFILVILGLFVARFYTFWDSKNYDFSRNWWIILARACGQVLNFLSIFILIVMLRNSITKLREMGLAVILPLDKHIYFHKITGRLIVVYSLIHTVAHLGNLCKYIHFGNQFFTQSIYTFLANFPDYFQIKVSLIYNTETFFRKWSQKLAEKVHTPYSLLTSQKNLP